MKKNMLLIHLAVICALALSACSASSETAQETTVVIDTSSVVFVTQTVEPSTQTEEAAQPSGNFTNGNPPPGNPPSGGGGMGASNLEDGLSTATGVYTLSGETAEETHQTYTATQQDQSGVYVTDGGVLILNNVTVNTSGETSSADGSSFYGLNAGILAVESTITVNSGTITTSGSGANGAFATGEGSVVSLSDVTITATGDGGHGVMATLGGEVNLTNVNMTTSGAHSAPIATDRGSGTVNATGGSLLTTGTDSPCYYSTGVLNITNSTCTADGSEAAVIEGANSINLVDSNVTVNVPNKWGVMIYQSFSGDAEGTEGIFTMQGGSLTYTDETSPLFYVNNSTGYITLDHVTVNVASGVLLNAAANDRWGTSGQNGGTVYLTANDQILNGDFAADAISSISVDLIGASSLTGAINANNEASSASLTMNASSTWTLTADSYLACLNNADGISGTTVQNIIGNGHNVYYDASSCAVLKGMTYTLTGRGELKPISK